jgi:hypothetical protein
MGVRIHNFFCINLTYININSRKFINLVFPDVIVVNEIDVEQRNKLNELRRSNVLNQKKLEEEKKEETRSGASERGLSNPKVTVADSQSDEDNNESGNSEINLPISTSLAGILHNNKIYLVLLLNNYYFLNCF